MAACKDPCQLRYAFYSLPGGATTSLSALEGLVGVELPDAAAAVDCRITWMGHSADLLLDIKSSKECYLRVQSCVSYEVVEGLALLFALHLPQAGSGEAEEARRTFIDHVTASAKRWVDADKASWESEEVIVAIRRALEGQHLEISPVKVIDVKWSLTE